MRRMARSGCVPGWASPVCLAFLSLALLWPLAAPVEASEASNHGVLFEIGAFGTKKPANPLAPIPAESFADPCGVAVDAEGLIYVADYYRDRILVFNPEELRRAAEKKKPPLAQAVLPHEDPLSGPCALAVGGSGEIDVYNYHHSAVVIAANRVPPVGEEAFGATTLIDSGNFPTTSPALRPTGLARDPATGRIYVDDRAYVAVYESSGEPVRNGAGEPLRIGLGSLGDGYGVAVSDFPGTDGFVYVADAEDGVVKVYDPAVNTAEPVQQIDGEATPAGRFDYLVDSTVAVDSVDGHVFLAHSAGELYESAPDLVDEFNAEGDYRGRILPSVLIAGVPTGLAVVPPGRQGEGDLYVTSGQNELSKVVVLAPTGPAHALAVSTVGSGSGSVTSEPSGIRCGRACTAEFNVGAEVELTAEPTGGSAFVEWAGDCSATTASTCRLTMDSAHEVTARFEPRAASGTVAAGSGSMSRRGPAPVASGAQVGDQSPPINARAATDRRLRRLQRQRAKSRWRGHRRHRRSAAHQSGAERAPGPRA